MMLGRDCELVASAVSLRYSARRIDEWARESETVS